MNDTKRYNTKRSSIGCSAKNCTYNPDGESCSADHIDVCGHSAETTGETCCNTFKHKSH
ncbi:MAG TPA: DUF1540 domain-containing protein [Clostridiales bacterium]|mgnify:CR=1 FL=1|nr:DUF1540 domain-containing protein [Clostridiales bacterium]